MRKLVTVALLLFTIAACAQGRTMTTPSYTVFDTPPDVVDPIITFKAGHYEIYWSWPQLRSTTQYGASFWSASNMGSFNAANVNDGNFTNTAFTGATAGAGFVRFDAGSPILIREWWLYHSALPTEDFTISYSDDDITYLPQLSGLVSMLRQPITIGGTNLWLTRYWVVNGFGFATPHRYWRINKTGNTATTVVEAWPRTFGDQYATVGSFRVYAGAFPGSAPLIINIPWNNAPTAAQPLWLPQTINGGPYPDASGNSFPYGAVLPISISVVSSGNQAESLGQQGLLSTSVTSDLWDTQSTQPVTLAAGLNSNIGYFIGPGLLEVNGDPGGAFSVGGFTAPAGGGARLRFFYDGTGNRALTIVNEDAGSTAANRIRTLTGANLVFAAGFAEFEIQYSRRLTRWIIVSARDSTGVK